MPLLRSASRLGVWITLLIVAHVAWPPSDQASAAPERPNLCRIEADAEVSPPAVLTGETVAVTMTARVSCDPMPRPVHVALVLVISSDHGPDAVGEALQIARKLVDTARACQRVHLVDQADKHGSNGSADRSRARYSTRAIAKSHMCSAPGLIGFIGVASRGPRRSWRLKDTVGKRYV